METGWPGVAFIGREDLTRFESWEVADHGSEVVMMASRWRLLDEVDAFCADRRFAIDHRTAVIIDIDKTAIGARGRNDQAIDRARIDALQRMLEQTLNTALTWDDCRRLYDRLNRPALHPLTADSQDAVAILCLAITGGLISETMLTDGASDTCTDLGDLIGETEAAAHRLPSPAREAVSYTHLTLPTN